ncbi:hypothetical protein ACRRTK_005448 [Alexandromys fortis]
MKEVVYWSPKKVADWLLENAMPEHCEPLEHFTGQDLINLTQEDFKKPPLCRVSSDNGQRLLDMIETLKMEHHIEAHKNGHANGHLSVGVDIPDPDGSFSIKIKPNGMPNGYRKEMIKIPMPEPERSQYPMEMISVVHEGVPPKEVQPPLPDTFFDHFNRVQWAFSICEINGMILVGLWLIQWLLLKYKSIVSRRFFCIVGMLYLYRCITMYVTTLPVPGMHFNCSLKLFGDWEAQVRRIMKLIAGGSLSITGSHNIVVGIFCILLAHDHYTVDMVVAYYITTRLFWWYHTMANQQVLKEASPMNLLAWRSAVNDGFEASSPQMPKTGACIKDACSNDGKIWVNEEDFAQGRHGVSVLLQKHRVY